ncbi:MAG: SDR family oxidoreductase [Candidatus Dormiibacterota bacterium]
MSMAESNERVAIVTGGGTGLGRAMAIALASDGTDVVVNFSRSEGEAAETAAVIREMGRRAKVVRADVAVEAQVASMVREAMNEFGQIDYLIINAGTTVFCDLSNLDGITESDWDRILGVNVKGAWFCAKHAAPHMKERGGHIVTISSTAGLMTMGSSIPYCVSKAGLLHLTRMLARALAPEIQVNSIAPGLLDTRWGRHHGEAGIAAYVERSLLHRIPSLDDICAQLLVLLRSRSTTGQTVVMDGGLTV